MMKSRYTKVGVLTIVIAALVFSSHLLGTRDDETIDALTEEIAPEKLGRPEEDWISLPASKPAESFDQTDMFEEDLEKENVLRGVFGAQLDDPWVTYLEHIQAAEAGNPTAQFEISRVLFECKGLPTQAELDAYITEGVLDAAMGAEVQLKLSRCHELITNIGHDRIDEWHNWQKKSAEAGYPLALGREVVFHPGKYSPDEARDVMLALVGQDDEEIYLVVASYYANFREDQHIEYEAWLRLACEQQGPCNIAEFRGSGEPPLLPDEQKQVEMAVARIRNAITNQRWLETGI